MAQLNPADIRNISITGHSGSGKTTLIERLMFTAGAIKRMGTIEEGNTVSDYTDEAKKAKHSLAIVPVHFVAEGETINLLDTPGLADFLGHAMASLAAVETVMVVVDAVRGVESTTRRLMAAAKERGLPRLIVINKIDSSESKPEEILASVQAAFGQECLPINLPSADRKGVVDVFDHTEDEPVAFSSVSGAHTRIVDQVVEVNEELMSEYLESGGAPLDAGKLRAAFAQAMREGHLVPVCFASAKTGAGASELLHVIAEKAPSPLTGARTTLLNKREDGTEEEMIAEPDANKPVLAHVFRVMVDPFVGKLGIFRVLQGTVRSKSEIFIGDGRKALRVGHMFRLCGKEHVEIHEAGPGDIAAISKLDELHFDAVIHSHAGEHLRIKPLPMPKPMFGLAVELKNHADEAKFSSAVHKLAEEDPCFRMERVAATRQTVLRGLGELHLRVVLDRLKSQWGIDVVTAPPKVAYRETVTVNADGHHRHKKQTGGSGQFGEVYLRIETLPPDHAEGFEFTSAVVGGTVPRQYWPAVEKGVRQVLQTGAIAGYPMTGVRCVLTDGKYHDVDSKEIAFVTAGKKAFIDAVGKAKPKLLEPWVVVEITAPSSYMGTIAGDLSTKRGRVQDTQMVGADTCLVRAVAPMAELQNYSNELKSLTGGAGSYTMDYSHEEFAPPQVQAQLVAAFKPHHDED